MENLHDFTESEAELSALNAEDSSSENAKSRKPENNNSTLPPFCETNTGYEYPPIAEKTPIAEEKPIAEKNTTNLVGDQNPTAENSDKSLRFEPTEYKNAPLEEKKFDFSCFDKPAEKREQEPQKELSLRFEPTEYKNAPLEEKKFDFSCFDKPAEDKNEEIPPALMPFFELADVLEKELPKQDQANEEEKKALAENILEHANEAKLSQYAEYLGRGGKIYVHIIDIGTPYITNNNKDIKLTKTHYDNAAKISNERFKALDVDLEVVIVWQIGSSPLTREEFQTRQADKTKRQAMPKEFDKEYNPMDSYVLVDNQGTDSEVKQGNLGLAQWSAKKPSITTMPNDWDKLDDDVDVVGQSHANNFLAFLNSSQLASLVDKTQQGFEIPNELGKINEAIENAIALAIEHEVGHHKFGFHAENGVGAIDYNGYKVNQLGGKSLIDFLKGKKQFTSRENISNGPGHIRETIMASPPKLKDTQKSIKADGAAVNNGYDEYMITMLGSAVNIMLNR